MKAAILKQYGQLPVLKEMAEPKPTSKNRDQILVRPVFSSIKQLDLSKASGKHYTKFTELPAIMGMDGVAQLDNGTYVYAMGLTGMLAERALINKKDMVELPKGLDLKLAAALPNTLIGADLPLKFKANIKQGDIVLINGATGATGAIAVQMAKYRGAKKIIVTGRNDAKLEYLKQLGADITIRMDKDEPSVIKQIIDTYQVCPFNIVLDYLWGRPAEIIMTAIHQLKLPTQVKFISVGSLAGNEVAISSQLLRSHNLLILGSGIGSLSGTTIQNYLKQDLPEIFAYATQHRIEINLATFDLSNITEAWKVAPAIIDIQR